MRSRVAVARTDGVDVGVPRNRDRLASASDREPVRSQLVPVVHIVVRIFAARARVAALRPALVTRGAEDRKKSVEAGRCRQPFAYVDQVDVTIEQLADGMIGRRVRRAGDAGGGAAAEGERERGDDRKGGVLHGDAPMR